MSLVVRPARSRRDRRAFVALPYRLHAHEPCFAAPPRLLAARQLDRRTNPFFAHADVALLLAERDGRVVGRISAQVDRNLQRFQGNRWGLFGFFACEDDQEATDALLEAATAFVRRRGCDRVVGPMSFTTNDECGLLVAGHDRLPTILTAWHPPYYRRLLEGAGLVRAVDALMWSLEVTDRDRVHPALWEMADRLEPDHGIVARTFDRRDLAAEVERFLQVYNAAWERNWGFVPLEPEEVRGYAEELRPVLAEDWAMVAEVAATGEVAGAALTLPDWNQAFRAVPDGRLLPLGWLALLRARRRIDRVRVLALGVTRAHRHTGVAARLYEMHFDAAARTPQSGGEMGWILETNTGMNRAMAGMGGTIVRRYRFYERLLEADAEPSGGGGGEYAGDWTSATAGDGRAAEDHTRADVGA